MSHGTSTILEELGYTQMDFQPSDYMGDNFLGRMANFPVNFFSGGMLARGGEPLTDHTVVSGLASVALPGYKWVAYKSGMSKAALASLIFAGYAVDKTVRHVGNKHNGRLRSR